MRISGLRRERARAMVTLLIILILGAALRFYRLGLVPPGFQFDEAYNVIDAVHVLEGEWQIFFPANGGREPLYTYWQALFVAGLGPNVFALRLASAVAGVATIALTYVLVRALLPHQPRRVATLTAAFLALSYWHIHFSRYAIRAILLPPLTILTFYGFWQGLEARRRPYLYLTVSGIFLAAAVYAHPAARLLPLVLAPFALYRALSHRAQARRYLGGLALVGLIAVVLLLPLGHYFWEHPWLFSGHPRDVSIFDPRVNEGDIPRALLTNL
ncbi:MAG: ArnT family glycosyltransferase, partial [Anaerolineae bacterium]